MPDSPGEAERLGLLGLARRAGHAAVGTRAVEEAGREGRLAAVVLAGDATENARRRLSGVLRRGSVPLLQMVDRTRLGAAVGKGPVAAVGLMDEGIARRFMGAAEAAVPKTRERRGMQGQRLREDRR